jgi:hypothetical protein
VAEPYQSACRSPYSTHRRPPGQNVSNFEAGIWFISVKSAPADAALRRPHRLYPTWATLSRRPSPALRRFRAS